ncbi:MAG: toll/interleukin-1 receptor domain-containing protein [Saprospiraceae bacterium]|nr:toll/interleukin-1 receptor domain-containing protein [Saprospiraceae bacterium]
MPNPKHFKIYLQGPEKWNQWRQQYPDIEPDLSGFRFVFVESHLRQYSKPGLNTTTYGMLMRSSLSDFDFSRTNLSDCVFWEIVLHRTRFQGANLSGTEFRQCDLYQVDLEAAELSRSTFVLSLFREANFQGAHFGQSHFAYSPLQGCTGLEKTVHPLPGHMDFLSLVHSQQVPFEFAQHFGINEVLFNAIRKLEPERFYDCFISYSTRNEDFVQYLRAVLLIAKVPCWYAPADYRLNADWHASKKSEDYELARDLYNLVDASDVLLLVVSNDSMRSEWVRKEVLRVRKQRVIGLLIEDVDPALAAQTRWLDVFGWLDFRNWRDPAVFRSRMGQLLVGVLRS